MFSKTRLKQSGKSPIIILLGLGGVAIAAIVFIRGYRTYQPPLLRNGESSPVWTIYDCGLFAWHYTRSVVLEQEWQTGEYRRARARAAWHRPVYYQSWFNIDPDDLLHIGAALEHLGLEDYARLLEQGSTD